MQGKCGKKIVWIIVGKKLIDLDNSHHDIVNSGFEIDEKKSSLTLINAVRGRKITKRIQDIPNFQCRYHYRRALLDPCQFYLSITYSKIKVFR